MRTRPPGSHVYPLKVPDSLWERFSEACRKNGRSYGWVLNRLIERYVAEGEAALRPPFQTDDLHGAVYVAEPSVSKKNEFEQPATEEEEERRA